MVDSKKPSIKDQSETKPLSDADKDFFIKLRSKVISQDIESTLGWRDKLRIARNMRQGIKRHTDFPYPGAPDIPLPETDKIIRKHKPRFVMSILSGKRLLQIRPLEGVQIVDDEMKESAKKATMEKYKGEYILAVEGSVPMGADGSLCCIAGRSAAPGPSSGSSGVF